MTEARVCVNNLLLGCLRRRGGRDFNGRRADLKSNTVNPLGHRATPTEAETARRKSAPPYCVVGAVINCSSSRQQLWTRRFSCLRSPQGSASATCYEFDTIGPSVFRILKTVLSRASAQMPLKQQRYSFAARVAEPNAKVLQGLYTSCCKAYLVSTSTITRHHFTAADRHDSGS